MKFGQLIEYDMKKILLKKSYIKCGREIILRSSKKSKLSISLDQQSKVLKFIFIVVNLRAIAI